MKPLFGHAAAVAAFRSGLDSGRLHHAWLISGPRGIGKSLFARKAALRVIAQGQAPVTEPGLDVRAGHPGAAMFEAGAHPDFRLVEREVWEKTDVLLPHEKRTGAEDPARSIRVIQIRWLKASLAGTTGVSSRRAVVVDCADDLEPSAANALLKSLEEPPASTIFLLVSHAPERLLPTIRSRCRMLRLGTLGRTDMEAALRSALPDAAPLEISSLVEVGEGAPGRALAYRGLDVPAMDKVMRMIAGGGDPTNQHRTELAQSLSLKSAQPRYEAFLSRAPSFIANAAKRRHGSQLAEAVKLWEQASLLSSIAVRQSLDAQATVFEMGTLIAGLAGRDGEG